MTWNRYFRRRRDIKRAYKKGKIDILKFYRKLKHINNLEIYKNNFLMLIKTLRESCMENGLSEQVEAFDTVITMIEKDVINDRYRGY